MVEPLPLPELTEDPPAGPNLELDATFGEMERAAQGKPEIQYGSVIEPATPPDWALTVQLASGLLERTRDLRVLATLTVAQLHVAGFEGFAAGLRTIRLVLETMWAKVHPQLDPEDDNDPMQRANVLQAVQDRALRPLRDMALAASPRTGPVSWRDLAIMGGALEAEPGREKVTEAAVRAAFTHAGPARLLALREAVQGAMADLVAISGVFDAQASSGSGPDYETLTKLLRDILREVTKWEAATAAPSEETAEALPAGDEAAGEATAATAAVGRPRAANIQSLTALGTREEALHALELAAAWFRTHEPSSPLPLLIDRARRLAPLPFLDILRDLAPDGLMQAQIATGAANE